MIAEPVTRSQETARAYARGLEVIAQAIVERRNTSALGDWHQAVVVPIGDAFVRCCSCGWHSVTGYATADDAGGAPCEYAALDRLVAARLLEDGPEVIDALRDAALRARSETP